MKRFLSIPACALIALGALTSCQKEEQTALQLADELTAELQKVTDYKSAEAVAPRVAAINKRFQNAGVRVFSVGGNALVGSDADAYAEAVCRLAREMGRVRSGKPMKDAESGDVDDISLVRAVGVASGASMDTPAAEQLKQGQQVIYNDNDANANTPPALPEYYGSKALSDALAYVADPEEFGPTRMDTDEDVPAIPEAVEIEASDDAAGLSVMPQEEPAEVEEPADDSSDDSGDDAEEEATDDSSDDSGDDAEVSVDLGDDSGDAAEEEATEDSSDDSGDDAEISVDLGDDSGDAAEEETTDDSSDDSGDAAEEETTDDSAEDETTDDAGEDDGMIDIEL